KVVATDAATYFFDPAMVGAGAVRAGSVSDGGDSTVAHASGSSDGPVRNPAVVILDADEWPGRAAGERYSRGDAVLHIELRKWADLLLVAPLDANTLAKLAVGLCDNC